MANELKKCPVGTCVADTYYQRALAAEREIRTLKKQLADARRHLREVTNAVARDVLKEEGIIK